MVKTAAKPTPFPGNAKSTAYFNKPGPTPYPGVGPTQAPSYPVVSDLYSKMNSGSDYYSVEDTTKDKAYNYDYIIGDNKDGGSQKELENEVLPFMNKLSMKEVFIWDLVKFVLCALVYRAHMTFNIPIKWYT